MPKMPKPKKPQPKSPEKVPSSEFEDDELIAEVVAASTNLPSLAEEEVDRFNAEVKVLLERRAQSGWANESEDESRAVFVFVDYPRMAFKGSNGAFERVIDLPMTSDPIFGKLYFLSFNASNGAAMALPCDVNDILDWLSQQGLGDRPVITAYRDTLRFSFRKSAADDEPKSDIIRDKPPELTIDELKAALRVFYEGNLVTPRMCGSGVWEPGCNATYIPAPNPEKAIQKMLKVALHSWFRGLVSVGTEDPVDKGRIDVRLLVPPGEHFGLRYWSIIELKVARSFHNSKKPFSRSTLIKEIVKGIGQANEFTADRVVDEGFLEIYDMRKDKSDDLLSDTRVAVRLNSCTVTVNATVRPMFGTADDARNAVF